MKKIVLIPDSFKGSLSSAEICEVLRAEIFSCFPEAEVCSVPVADGGEGTVDAFLAALGGTKIPLSVKGPYMEDREAFYGILPDGTAVVEMAAAAGLPLVGENRRAGKTTTYGVGQLIQHAVGRGCKKIILGLGGSATNDGGCGCASALGARFLSKDGKEFIPLGESLCEIHGIDLSGVNLKGASLTVMCDIDNPLCGERGASRVFGPQKGADEEEILLLDKGLSHLAELIRGQLGCSVLNLPGAGAAGGMGAGAVAFLGGELKMGIETVLDAVAFERLAEGADLVITGEGRIDSQTLGGKVIAGVAARTKGKIPLIALVGAAEEDIQGIYERGVSGVFPICRKPMSLEEAMKNAGKNLALTARDLFTLMKALGE